jgi:hypothetical protein
VLFLLTRSLPTGLDFIRGELRKYKSRQLLMINITLCRLKSADQSLLDITLAVKNTLPDTGAFRECGPQVPAVNLLTAPLPSAPSDRAGELQNRLTVDPNQTRPDAKRRQVTGCNLTPDCLDVDAEELGGLLLGGILRQGAFSC